jgi:hypothetical protein
MRPGRQSVPLFAAVGVLLCTPPVRAGFKDNPPPLAGWSRSISFGDDSPQVHGILLPAARIGRSSPTIGEIDGNGANGKELAVGSSDGNLFVYGADGSLRWSAFVLPSSCTTSPAGSALINSTPAVGALYGDGTAYVLVTYGASVPSDCDGGLVAYDGRNGQLAWRFSTRAWQTAEGYPPEGLYGAMSSPTLADADGDGRLEIAFGGLDRNFYLLNSDGSVRWYYHAADTVWSSPVFVNIDNQGPLEVVVGTNTSANPEMVPPTSGGGYVYAFGTNPRSQRRINFRGSLGYIWRTANPGQVIHSAPARGDVLPDPPGDELVVGSGCFLEGGSADKAGPWVQILGPADGAVLQTLDVPPGGTCIQSSPALGDIDDDGKLEIVVTMGSDEDMGGDSLGRIVAWDPEKPTPKWSTVPYSPHEPPSSPAGNDEFGGDLQSPVIADIDGNGSLEVLAANFWSVHVLAGADGTPLSCQDNTCGKQTSLFAWGTLKSMPAVADADNDGDLEVFIGGMHIWSPGGGGLPPAGAGMLYAWTDFAGVIGSKSGSHPPYSAPWPMFHSNPVLTGAPGESPPPFEPEPPPDPCEALAANSQERIACDIDVFLSSVPCELSQAIQKKTRKASDAIVTAAAAESKPKALRLLKRARRRLSVAWRKVSLRRLSAECRSAVREDLFRFIERVRTVMPTAGPQRPSLS